MSTECTATEAIEYLPDCTPEQLDEVLALLERWSDRSQNHVTPLRRHPRHKLRTTVLLGRLRGSLARMGPEAREVVFHVPLRNLSQSGVGLIAPVTFAPRHPSEGTPIVRTDALLSQGANLRLIMNTNADRPMCMLGKVVRLRPTHRGFVEVGIHFTGKG